MARRRKVRYEVCDEGGGGRGGGCRHGHRNCGCGAARTPGPKSKYKKKIQPSLFGMHVHELSDPSPQVHQKFGAIRIWDNGVRWDEVNTAPGVYDWTLLDQVVANAEATGAQRIMFVLGSTPSWLATDTSVPNYLNAPGRTRCRRV